MLYESKYYGIIDSNSPHLMHHGIKGQKWGVRRYQYESGLLTPLGRKRLGFGIGEKVRRIAKTVGDVAESNRKQQKITDDAAMRAVDEYWKNVGNAKGKGLRENLSVRFGRKNAEMRYRNEQHKNEELSKAAYTKFGKNDYKIMAENAKNMADFYGDRSKGIKDYLNISVTRANGRKTTKGAQMIDNALTKGRAGLIADAAYSYAKHKNSKASKSEKNSSNSSGQLKIKSQKAQKSISNGKKIANARLRHIALSGITTASLGLMATSSNTKVNNAAIAIGSAAAAGMIGNGLYTASKTGYTGIRKKKKE